MEYYHHVIEVDGFTIFISSHNLKLNSKKLLLEADTKGEHLTQFFARVIYFRNESQACCRKNRTKCHIDPGSRAAVRKLNIFDSCFQFLL